MVGLYPNIPHKYGLNALKKALQGRENPSVSTSTILELAELVLKNNYFEYNQQIYKQKRGTAMGTKFAPSYAILALAAFEEYALKHAEITPEVWWRFIDDIFVIWLHGEEKFLEFVDYLNSLHPTLKFTAKYSGHQTDFLDALVKLKNGHIETDLFTKETDTHQYLHFSSCHTYHTKKGIPYGQALRLRRIISDNTRFESMCGELRGWLLDRGFDAGMTDVQIDKAKVKNREELINYRKEERALDTRLNLVLRYHPALSNKVHNIIKQHHPILLLNDEHRKVFEDLPRVTYKRAKNLKDSLVRASLPLPDPDTSLYGSRVCGKKRCLICKNVQTTKSFTNREGSYTYEIRKGPLNCDSACVVYLLQCRTCKIQYVGSTETPFRLRYNNYTSAHRAFCKRKDADTLDKGKNIPQRSLHEHFAQADHKGIDDFLFTLIDSAATLEGVRNKEAFWQCKLKVFEPNGLNVRDAPQY